MGKRGAGGTTGSVEIGRPLLKRAKTAESKFFELRFELGLVDAGDGLLVGILRTEGRCWGGVHAQESVVAS